MIYESASEILLIFSLARTLLGWERAEVTVEVEGPVTLGAVLDAVEDRYPVLRGNEIREHVTQKAVVRSCGSTRAQKNFFQRPVLTPFWSAPDEIVSGKEPSPSIGAICGG